MRALLMAGFLLLPGLIQAGQLQVVTTQMSPYQVLENGQVAGSNTDWVRQLLAEANVEAEFAVYPWARAYQLARTEPNVLIYPLARLPEREDSFHWIGRIASFELALLVKAEQLLSLQSGLRQGKSLSLALPRDHAVVPMLQNLPQASQLELFYTASTDDAFQLLLNGRVDAVVENPLLLPELLRPYQLPPDALQVLQQIPASRADAYLAASKTTDMALVQQLQQAWQRLHGAKFYGGLEQAQPAL